MATAPIAAAFQVFRAVAVTSVVHSAALAKSVSGGVLRSTIRTMPGSAACFTALAMWAGSTSLREKGSLFVASGINLFDSFDNLIISQH